MNKIVLVISLIFALQVRAEGITCESGKDQRKLLLSQVEKGCKLEYTKSGETKEVASQKVGKDFCENMQSKIKTKLEASQFKCTE